jgi:hypothetical protein
MSMYCLKICGEPDIYWHSTKKKWVANQEMATIYGKQYAKAARSKLRVNRSRFVPGAIEIVALAGEA